LIVSPAIMRINPVTASLLNGMGWMAKNPNTANTWKNRPMTSSIVLPAMAVSPRNNWAMNEPPKRIKMIPAMIDAVPLSLINLFVFTVTPVYLLIV
jgi:hypothetical protein